MAAISKEIEEKKEQEKVVRSALMGGPSYLGFTDERLREELRLTGWRVVNLLREKNNLLKREQERRKENSGEEAGKNTPHIPFFCLFLLGVCPYSYQYLYINKLVGENFVNCVLTRRTLRERVCFALVRRFLSEKTPNRQPSHTKENNVPFVFFLVLLILLQPKEGKRKKRSKGDTGGGGSPTDSSGGSGVTGGAGSRAAAASGICRVVFVVRSDTPAS